jgi:hypothetical protein
MFDYTLHLTTLSDVSGLRVYQNSKQAYLRAHGRQVVTPRKIINIRAQSSPVSFRLSAVIPLNHDLIDAACAVHDLLHLHFCFEIIRRRVELTSKTVCRAIQVVHSIFEVVFCLLALVRTSICVRRIRTLAARCCSAALSRVGAVLSVLSAIFEIVAKLVHTVFHFADAVSNLRLCTPTCAFVNGFV